MAEYRVRFRNDSNDEIRFVAVHALAQVDAMLQPGEYITFQGPYTLYDGDRVICAFGTFPPALKFPPVVVNINHDYFLIRITNTGIQHNYGAADFPT